MPLAIPDPSLVLLVGPSGCGKSTFARRHFSSTEIVSSDDCRALVSDDPADQQATAGAFAVLHAIVEQRLKYGRLTVVDATNLQSHGRAPLLALARKHHLPAGAIVFDLPLELCASRAAGRTDRVVASEIVEMHAAQLERAQRALPREGLRWLHELRTPDAVDALELQRQPLPPDRRHDAGPFDIIGDVHGCAGELEELLAALGYLRAGGDAWDHPEGRRALFVGDLVDRGPRVRDVLAIAMAMVEQGTALCVPGNHDDKLMRKLRGRNVVVAHGLAESLASIADEPASWHQKVADFIEELPSHLVLDGGRLVVAHAGMRADLQGRDSRRVRDFALYGDTTGEVDEMGVPVRRDWAQEYRGAARVVYGHTPVPRPSWVNETINIDTGCVFGGRLTALRYPELACVSVEARHGYAVPSRAFLPAEPSVA